MPDNSHLNADQNPTQPLPASTAPPANATPFDTHLVDDPNAPRHTQPLPSQFAPPQRPSQFAPPQTPTYAPHSLPRQVVPNNQVAPNNYVAPHNQAANSANATSSTRSANQNAPPIAPTVTPNVAPPFHAPIKNVPVNSPTSSLPASRLPLATIAGLAAIGGALAVVFGSAFFRRVAPVPESARGNSTVVIAKKNAPDNAGTIILQRPDEDVAPEKIQNDIGRDNTRKPAVVAPQVAPKVAPQIETLQSNEQQGNVENEPNESPSREAKPNSDDKQYSNEYSNSVRDENSTRDDTEIRADANRADAIRDNANRRDEIRRDDSSWSDKVSSNDGISNDGKFASAARFVEKRRAYSIRPPREFRVVQKGRRTIWKAPNGAQLLVEVGDNDGEAPRAGWEKLDRALARKYGSRYQSRGIRNTTLNGREAAAWEFDLKQKNGVVVRKMDVAVVDGKNGYAVLASAPVEKFEAMRPTFDRVLDSFQIESTRDSSNNSSNSSNSATNEDDAPRGY